MHGPAQGHRNLTLRSLPDLKSSNLALYNLYETPCQTQLPTRPPRPDRAAGRFSPPPCF